MPVHPSRRSRITLTRPRRGIVRQVPTSSAEGPDPPGKRLVPDRPRRRIIRPAPDPTTRPSPLSLAVATPPTPPDVVTFSHNRMGVFHAPVATTPDMEALVSQMSAMGFGCSASCTDARPLTTPALPPTNPALFAQVTAHRPVLGLATRGRGNPLESICFWNCNGLRSVMKKGLESLLRFHRPSVLCLSELKIRQDKLEGISGVLTVLLRKYGYTSWLFNTCDAKNTGYSGTAIISRIRPELLQEGWSTTDLPDPEGRVVTASFHNLVLVTTYSPCSGLNSARIAAQSAKRKDHDHRLRAHIQKLRLQFPDRPILLGGDLNVAPREMDVHDPVSLKDWPGVRPWERDLFVQLTDETGLQDAWARLHPEDTTSHYTYFQSAQHRRTNQGWRLDLACADEHLFSKDRTPHIADVCHLSHIGGSDHVPLLLHLNSGVPCTASASHGDDERPASDVPCAAPASHKTTTELTVVTSDTISPVQEGPADDLAGREVPRADPALSGERTAPGSVSTGLSPALPSDTPRSLSLLTPATSAGSVMEDDKDFDLSDLRDALLFKETTDATTPADDAQRDVTLSEAIARARTASVIEATVPHVRLHVGPQRVALRAMADSGASYSIITPSTLEKVCGKECRVQDDCWLPTFILADNSKRPALGRITLDLHWRDGDHLQHDFYVIPSPQDSCILGVDFFVRTGATINFAQNCITFRDLARMDFKILPGMSNRGALHPVYVKQSCVLRPSDTSVLRCSLGNLSPLYGLEVSGFIVPAHKGLPLGTRVANSLSAFSTKGAGVLSVANLSAHASRVRSHALMGFFQPVQIQPPSNPLPEAHALRQDVLRLRPSVPPPTPEQPDAVPLAPAVDSRDVSIMEDADDFLTSLSLWPTSDVLAAAWDDCPAEDRELLDGVQEGLHSELLSAKARIPPEDWPALCSLFAEFRDIFAVKGEHVSVIKGSNMRINIPDGTPPVGVRARRYNPTQRAIIIDYVTKLQASGVIGRVPLGEHGGWNSQLLMIPKPDGSLRPTLDLRAVNAATQPMVTSLPRIEDCLDAMQGAHWITVMDISQCYFQMNLHPDDRKYTAFTTPVGKFWFHRAPMGAKDSQQYWLDLSDNILGGLKWNSVVAYSDDISCFTKAAPFRQHLADLRSLFETLREHNVRLKPTKTQIARREVSYVGYIVDKDGIRPDPKVKEAVSKWSIDTLNTLKKLRRWVGFCNFWRRFIPHFAQRLEPLRNKLKKGGFSPDFTPEERAAFEDINSALLSDPVLRHPDFKRPFEIHSDASGLALAAALLQRDDEGKPYAVAYFSKSLTPAQKGYATHEQETLALLSSLELWSPYFHPNPIKVVLDCEGLKHLLKPHSKYTGRQLRWLLRLSTYNLIPEHRAGKKHVVPDMLSRSPTTSTYGDSAVSSITPLCVATSDDSRRDLRCHTCDKDFSSVRSCRYHMRRFHHRNGVCGSVCRAHAPFHALPFSTGICQLAAPGTPLASAKEECPFVRRPACSAISAPRADPPIDLTTPDTLQTFRRQQRVDPYCLRIRLRLRQSSPCDCSGVHRLPCPHAAFRVDPVNDLLLHHPKFSSRRGPKHLTAEPLKPQVVIPESLLTSVLHHHHGHVLSGHLGYKKTLHNILRNFWRPGLGRLTRRWIGACLVCARRKPRRRFGTTPPGVLTSRFPWDLIAFDTVGPLPLSARKNRWVLTVVDTFTRYPIAVPLPSLHADVIARALFDHVFSIHSCPRIMLSDNATTLCGEVVSSLCRIFGIGRITTMPYSPQLNSFVERWHGYLGAALTAVTKKDKSDWDLWIPVVLYAYRTTTNSTTGYSPFQALFGRSPQLDIDMLLPSAERPTSLPTYVANTVARLRKIHTDIRHSTAKVQRQNLLRRQRAFKDVHFKQGEWVLVAAEGRAEKLPAHIPRTRKLLDRLIGPYQITEVIKRGFARKYRLRNTDTGKEEVHRGEHLSLWTPWVEPGVPSVPAREYFSNEERRTINKQVHKYVLPEIKVGDLFVFPRTMNDVVGTKGFGVARLTDFAADGSLIGQWLSNGDSNTPESLTGTFQPCWTDGLSWYCAAQKRAPSDVPCLTTDYPAPIRKDIIADAGFALTAGLKLPAMTLRRMSEHRRFEWELTQEELRTLGLQDS